MKNFVCFDEKLFPYEVEGVFLDLINQDMLSDEEVKAVELEAWDLTMRDKDLQLKLDPDTDLKLECLTYYLNPVKYQKHWKEIWQDIYVYAEDNGFKEVMTFCIDVIGLEI